jgi:hypothetical protein
VDETYLPRSPERDQEGEDGGQPSRRRRKPDKIDSPDLQSSLGEHHLTPMSEPSDDSRDGEQDDEEIGREALERKSV